MLPAVGPRPLGPRRRTQSALRHRPYSVEPPYVQPQVRRSILRPQDGQTRERFLHSRALLWIPDATIRKPIAVVVTRSARTCRSRLIVPGLFPGLCGGNTRAARVRMGLEVHVAAAAVADVRVQLGGREIGVAEHLLHAAQVGASFEQMRREGVAQKVRM